jgi:hypothetical protein
VQPVLTRNDLTGNGIPLADFLFDAVAVGPIVFHEVPSENTFIRCLFSLNPCRLHTSLLRRKALPEKLAEELALQLSPRASRRP